MSSVFHLLFISSLLCSLSRVESVGSVFFIDSQSHHYLRSPSTNDVVQTHSMSLTEVGAAVSVLLGFAPPATLSAAGSSKLNEVLKPNPFDRPRAVLMLEVKGVKEFPLVDDQANAKFNNAFISKIISGSDKAHIQLPGEEVFAVSLDEGSEDCTDKELSDFASRFGGSYVYDGFEKLNGELTIPLPSDANVNLRMSKKADREFIARLLAMFRNTRRAIEIHEDLSQSSQSPAELMMGCFDGIKVLQEQYGPEGVVQEGLELLLATLSKMLDSLQAVYKGQIVGVIVFNGTPLSEQQTMLNVMFTSWPSARSLAEKEVSHNATNTTIAEFALVRKTLAWLTAVVLLVSTILGIYFLRNMPLTRDTLLYSNVKLD